MQVHRLDDAICIAVNSQFILTIFHEFQNHFVVIALDLPLHFLSKNIVDLVFYVAVTVSLSQCNIYAPIFTVR